MQVLHNLKPTIEKFFLVTTHILYKEKNNQLFSTF